MWVEMLTRSDRLLTDVKMQLAEHQGAMPGGSPFGPSVTAASAAAFVAMVNVTSGAAMVRRVSVY